MFDRRFDEEEFFSPADEDLSSKSVDGIPSISQLLASLNEKMSSAEKEEEKKNNDNAEPVAEKAPASADDDKEPPPSETAAAEPETALKQENAPEPEALPEQAPPPEPKQDIPPEEQISIPVSSVPVFSSDQMNAEKEKAREEGRRLGLEEGREAAWQEAMVSLEKQNADILSSIDSSLKNIFAGLEKSAQTSIDAALDFAMAVCKKALPALCETNAVSEIRDLLEKNLHFLKDEPKISLRLNPFLADQIKPVLTDLVKKEAYSGKIAVIRDDALAVGDCRVEWKNGGLEKNVQDVLNHTEELIKLYTHAAKTDTPSAEHTGEERNG